MHLFHQQKRQIISFTCVFFFPFDDEPIQYFVGCHLYNNAFAAIVVFYISSSSSCFSSIHNMHLRHIHIRKLHIECIRITFDGHRVRIECPEIMFVNVSCISFYLHIKYVDNCINASNFVLADPFTYIRMISITEYLKYIYKLQYTN